MKITPDEIRERALRNAAAAREWEAQAQADGEWSDAEKAREQAEEWEAEAAAF